MVAVGSGRAYRNRKKQLCIVRRYIMIFVLTKQSNGRYKVLTRVQGDNIELAEQLANNLLKKNKSFKKLFLGYQDSPQSVKCILKVIKRDFIGRIKTKQVA